jgi:hypothetical protein
MSRPPDPERAAAPGDAEGGTHIVAEASADHDSAGVSGSSGRAPLGGHARTLPIPESHREPSPIAIHCNPALGGDGGAILDALAAAKVAIQAPCGSIRVPLRPPWPPGAVHCPICWAIRDGELRGAS